MPIPDYETIMLPLLKFAFDTNEYSKVAIELWKQITNPTLAIDYFQSSYNICGNIRFSSSCDLFMCYYDFLRGQKETSVNGYS